MKHSKKVLAGIGVLLLATLIGSQSLFNIKGIATVSQYDEPKTIELIVQKRQGSDSLSLLQSVGGILVAETPIINGFVAEIPADSLFKFTQQEGVLRYSLNHPVVMAGAIGEKMRIGQGNQFDKPLLFANDYRQLVKADAVNEKGTGVTIAVLDSGVGSDSFSYDSLNVVEAVIVNDDATTPEDLYGHGTHVAGIINGKGLNEVIGIAPEAKLINVKLGDDQGNLSEIDLLIGLQWVYDFKDDYDIKIVNLSVSSSKAESYLTSPLSAAVEQLWLNGVTVVTAAGNDLNNPTDINYAPANNPFIITAGAVDGMGKSPQQAEIAKWSKRGLTSEGVPKPEVTAPGVKIISLLSRNDAILAVEHPEAVINQNYIQMSGTSMAAPMVSGTIALMLEANPGLTPNDIKSILLATTISYKDMTDTAGVIDARKAVEIAKDTKKFLEIKKYENSWPLSYYMLDSGESIDWTKASWTKASWTKASWTKASWTKASWTKASWTMDYVE